MRPDAPEIRHLVVRLPNWLGDTVMALPTLRALRASLPGRRITVVGPWAFLLADQGVADHGLPYPRDIRGRVAAIGPLLRLGADTALLLPNSLESALVARVFGARRIIGYARDGRTRLLTDPLPLPEPRRHQVDEYLGLLAPFGVEPGEAVPRWLLSPDGSAARIAALLPATAPADRLRIGLHVGAAYGPSKLWPADRVATLARELQRRGFAPVLLGTPSAGADAVVEAVGLPLPSLVGRDSADLLPALLARLHLLVSPDTGVAHLAAALEVPVVTLFGPTDPRRSAPRGTRCRVLWKPPPCAPCFLRACPIDHPCMRGIAVDEVVSAVEELLSAGAGSRRSAGRPPA